MASNVFQIYGSIFLNDKDVQSTLSSVSEGFDNTFQNIGRRNSNFISNVGDGLSKVGGFLLGTSTAIGGAALKMYMPFEDSLAQIKTLCKDETIFAGIKDNMLKMSSELGVSATEVGAAIYDGLSSGIDAADISGFTEKMIKLSKAGFTSVSTATDVCTTILNAYGLEIADTDKIMDRLIQTQDAGKVTVDELGASMGKVIPTAASMGVNVDQLCAGYALLTKQGIGAAEATTYMNGMFDELGKSGTDVSNIIKEKTGKSFQELMASGADLSDVLGVLKEHADANGLSMQDLFGNTNSAKAAIALFTEDGAAFKEELQGMAASTGKLNENFEIVDNTLSSKIAKSVESVKNAFIRLGEKLMPVVENTIVPAIENFCDWVANLDDSAIESAAKWIEWGVKVGAILAVGGKITSWIGNITSLITTISGISGAAGAAGGAISGLGSIGAMLSNPAGWVVLAITAITGLTVAFMENQKQLDKNEQKFNEAADNLDNFTGRLRSNESIWAKIFGKEYTFKFSAEFEEAKTRVEEQQQAMLKSVEDYYKKKWELDHDGCEDEKEHAKHREEFHENYEKEHFKSLMNIKNNFREHKENMLIELGTYLQEEYGLSSFAIGNLQTQYSAYYDEKAAAYEANWTRINEILADCSGDTSKLTHEMYQELITIQEENEKIQLQLTEGTAEDRYNAWYMEYVKEKELLTNQEKAHTQYEKNVYDAINDGRKKISQEIDKKIEKIKENGMISEQEKNEEINRLQQQQLALSQFADDFGRRTDQNIKNGMSFANANKAAFESFIADLNNGKINAAQFGYTNEQMMGLALESMLEAGAGAEELEAAIRSIPEDKRADVVANIENADRAQTLKNVIDGIKSKNITIRTYYETHGLSRVNYKYVNGVAVPIAKGSEGIIAKAIGGSVTRTATALVGEQGPELVELPEGAKVKTHRETNNLMNNKPQIIQVVLDGRVVAESIAPYTGQAQANRNKQERW